MAKKETKPSPRNAKIRADKKAAKKSKEKTEQPVMPTIDLDAFQKNTGYVIFCALRGRAVQAYGKVEQSLFRLFSSLSGMPLDIAGVIFFKITSSRARDKILEKLMRKKHSDTYMIFWKSLTRLIDSITHTRNYIIHWDVCEFSGSGPFSGLGLTMPNFYDRTEQNVAPIGPKDFCEFIAKCDIISRLCNMFWAFIDPDPRAVAAWGAEPRKTWHDIFQQPAVYPLQDNHPLCTKKPAPETPLPPSPE